MGEVKFSVDENLYVKAKENVPIFKQHLVKKWSEGLL